MLRQSQQAGAAEGRGRQAFRQSPPRAAVAAGTQPVARIRTGLRHHIEPQLVFEETDHARLFHPLHESVAKAGDEPTCDLGDILMPVGSLIEGRVLDAAGGAVAGARMLWYRERIPGGGDWMTAAELVGESDASGHYRLARRFAPGWRRETLIAIGSSGVGWIQPTLSRKRGVLREQDIRLHHSGNLRVEVRDRFGNPVVGASVIADINWRPLGVQPLLAIRVGRVPAIRDRFSRTIGTDGVAAFTMLPVGGPFIVCVRARRYRQLRKDIELEAGRVRRLVVTLGRDVPLTVTGRVSSADGASIAGADVRIGRAHTNANSSGIYRVTGVAAPFGRIRVRVSGKGFTTATEWCNLDGPATKITQDITLARAGAIHGTVVDETGKPVAGTAVWIGGGTGRSYRMTDTEGKFSFADAPHGAHTMSIIPPPLKGPWRPVPPRRVGSGDSPLRIQLRREAVGVARLEVEVFDRATGQPLDPHKAFLMVLRGSTGSFAQVEKQVGQVRASKLAAGEWTLMFESSAGHRATQRFIIAPGQRLVKLRLNLPAPGEIEGRLDVEGLSPDAMPKHITLQLQPPGSGYLEAPGTEHRNGNLSVDLSKGREFVIRKVKPDTPIEVVVVGDKLSGTGRASVASEEKTVMTIRVVHRR